MSDADALKKAIFRLSFNVYSLRLNFKRNIGTAPEATPRGYDRVPCPGIVSDAERFERHQAWFDGLLAGQQRSCVFVCLVALHPVASAVRESAVCEAVWITAA